MRVQNHLRKMGVAGTALRCLLDSTESGWGLPKVVVEIPETGSPKPRSVSLDEALPGARNRHGRSTDGSRRWRAIAGSILKGGVPGWPRNRVG